MIEPADRSMPPLMMTIVCPMAAIAVSENARATPRRLSVVKKTGDRNASSVQRMIRATRMFSSLIRVSQPITERRGALGSAGADDTPVGPG
jgi:hypothetical protein